MSISTKTRVAKAGIHMAESIKENVHLLYLNDNALEYLQGLLSVLNLEFEQRKKDFIKKKKVW